MTFKEIFDQFAKKISWRGVLIAMVGFLILFWLIIYFYQQAIKSKAAGESVNLAFDPATASVQSGQDFSSTVKATPSSDMNLRGYAFTVNFDKSKASVKDITYKLGAVSSGLGDDNSKLSSINQSGTIKIQGELQNSAGKPITTSVQTDVVTIKFNAITDDPSSIAVDSSTTKFYKIGSDYVISEIPGGQMADLSVNGGKATDTPTPTQESALSGTPTPTPQQNATGSAILKLKLKFQGIVTKPTAATTMDVRVKLGGEVLSSPTDYQTATFTVDDNAVWTGTVGFDVTPGVHYIVYVKGPKHIQKKICDATPTETSPGSYHCATGAINIKKGENNFDFSGILLLAGDLPLQDGVVNAYDISLVRNNLGKSDPDSLKLADINLDGIVDTQDYSLIIAALSVRADEE